jgi:hypothetical protein
MLNLIIFSAVIYTLAFAGVYKRPLIFQPFVWLFKQVGLGKAWECMICLPMWMGFAVSAINLILIPNVELIPTLAIAPFPIFWYEYVAHIIICGLVAGSICFLIDKVVDLCEFNSKVHFNGKNILND